MKAIKILLSLLLLPFLFGTCSAPDESYYGTSELDIRDMLYVSEVHWAGTVDNNGENNNPNDDFIELRSWHKGDLNVGGWTIEVQGSSYLLITLPEGTVIHSKDYFTIGNNTNGAFTTFDMIVPELELPGGNLKIKVYDGSPGKYSDTAHFEDYEQMPAGYNLPALRKSAVRLTEYFGPVDALVSWVTYGANITGDNVRASYSDSVYASPGDDRGEIGETSNDE